MTCYCYWPLYSQDIYYLYWHFVPVPFTASVLTTELDFYPFWHFHSLWQVSLVKQGTLTRPEHLGPPPRHNALMFERSTCCDKYMCIYRCMYVHTCMYMYIYMYWYTHGCACVNVCLHMCILFYILSTDCVCFMDFDIWTADGDLIVLVYITSSLCDILIGTK